MTCDKVDAKVRVKEDDGEEILEILADTNRLTKEKKFTNKLLHH